FFGLGDEVHRLAAFDIWRNYVRYVGAGAVATGGIVSLLRALPAMRQSLEVALKGLRTRSDDRRRVIRTEQDLHPMVVVGGTIALGLSLWLIPTFHLGLIEAVLAIGFAFVFVVVSARMVGLIGSTSQPV